LCHEGVCLRVGQAAGDNLCGGAFGPGRRLRSGLSAGALRLNRLSTQKTAQSANDVTRADTFPGIDTPARRAATCAGGAATAAPSTIVAVAVATIAIVGPSGRGDHAGG
jgi:hypothetical protein